MTCQACGLLEKELDVMQQDANERFDMQLKYYTENLELKKELDFYKKLIEVKVGEHAKDNEELTARIRDLERENSKLQELVEHYLYAY